MAVKKIVYQISKALSIAFVVESVSKVISVLISTRTVIVSYCCRQSCINDILTKHMIKKLFFTLDFIFKIQQFSSNYINFHFLSIYIIQRLSLYLFLKLTRSPGALANPHLDLQTKRTTHQINIMQKNMITNEKDSYLVSTTNFHCF